MYNVPVAVKDTLRDGRLKKNYRFVVLNDDGIEDFTIDNDNLVSESVNIDERMCSGDTLKFGLCEGASVEFQYFGLENIIGRRLQAFIDVKLESQWLQVANYSDISSAIYRITEATAYEVIIPANQTTGVYVSWRHNGTHSQYVSTSSETQTVSIGDLSVNDEIILSRSITGRTFSAIINKSLEWYPIPLGFFDVKNCSRQASTGIIKVTAYNKLQSDYLNTKANNRIRDELGFSGTMAIYDIQKLLLETYQIEEDVGQIVGVITSGEITSVESITNSLGNFRFTNLYGVKSPINAYRAGVSSTSTSFGIWIISQKPKLNYESNYIRFNAYYGTLEGLEANIVAYIKKVIDDAQLNKSGDEVIDYICSSTGFQNVFSIKVPYYGRFSTVQWDYEERNGLAHSVSGPITDERVQLLTYEAELIIPETIDLRGPAGLSFWFDGTVQNVGSYTYSDRYQYYADSSLTIATEPCPYATFSDGHKYFMDYEDPETQQGFWNIAGWDYSALPDMDKVRIDPLNVEDFTLRDIISAVYESLAQFGQLDRETDLFSGVSLNYEHLFPSESLYPANDFYPGGAELSGFKAMYSKLWADEGNVHKWKYLIITYKALDGEGNEIEKELQRTINADGTDNYNMSDNWLLRHLVWTASAVSQIADAMVEKMRDITWFPFEMWCAGLPYLETGDEIEIPLGEETYTSYILQRQLKGIQNLQDTYINGTLDIF